MANIVIMPKQGLQMTEGYITKWLKAEGESVNEGEPLFEMETDKLTITIDSSFSGTLIKIIHPEGSTVPITEAIAVIGEAGEDISSLDIKTPVIPAASVNDVKEEPVVEATAETAPRAPAEVTPAAPAPVAAPLAIPRAPGDRVFITPRARMRCLERGIVDFTKIPGTGDDGLIIERDVLNYKIPQTCGVNPGRMSIRANIASAEKYAQDAQANSIDFTVDGFILRAAAIATKKYDAFKDVAVMSVCSTSVEEYYASLGSDEDAVVSVSGIYTSEGSRFTTVSVGFNEDVFEASVVAEYLTYLKGLIENPVVMMAL